MKPIRLVLWVAVFLLGGFLAYATLTWTTLRDGNQGRGFGQADIGGAFTAVRSDGKQISQQDLIGRPHVLFFGFTHCPDVCPTTLYEASLWLKGIGDKGNDLDVYFVSVDPERDTPEVLSDYLSAFDNRIRGITGTPEQIEKMLKAWRVFAEKVPTEDDDYTMNHTATTYLMDASGKFFGTIAYGENKEVAQSKLERLVTKGS